MSAYNTDPRAAQLTAQIQVVITAIQSVQPEAAASTASLQAVALDVNQAIVLANNLLTLLSTSTVPSDAGFMNWVITTLGDLSSYLNTVNSFIGADGANAILVSGTTLFHLAAAWLNDWTRGLDIGLVNSIQDPTITSGVYIAFPRN